MTSALVLMKAMPPTKGHRDLIKFAEYVANNVTVLIDTNSWEPMIEERVDVLHSMVNPYRSGVYHWEDAPQDPESEKFWEIWTDKLTDLNEYQPYEYVIGSETYCKKIAEIIGARYLPYDPDRELNHTKATDIRNNVMDNFDKIAPEFQEHLLTRVTVFGAESTGKTTLSKELAGVLNGHWKFEWARPYLEYAENVITKESMTEIWTGQEAVQRMAMNAKDKPFVIQDTDLFSTIGYWEQPHWAKKLGAVPDDLKFIAQLYRSDLYVITQSNIPFEEDPLRYGGDHRESDDNYWIQVAERYKLNYVVLRESDFNGRVNEALEVCTRVAKEKQGKIRYDRNGL